MSKRCSFPSNICIYKYRCFMIFRQVVLQNQKSLGWFGCCLVTWSFVVHIWGSVHTCSVTNFPLLRLSLKF